MKKYIYFEAPPSKAGAALSQTVEAGGPASSPGQAFEEPCDAGRFLYRILRKGETPWALRSPPDTTALPFQQLRSLLLPAIAFGNQPQHTSPFLHCTSRLSTCWKIFSERRALYSNWMIRITRPLLKGVGAIELGGDNGKKYLQDFDGDTALLEHCCQLGRQYAMKDREVVLLAKPAPDAVEYWDEQERAWRSVEHAKSKYALTASSQPSTPVVDSRSKFHL